MPSIFSISGYKVYFWSNEGLEPIHVHVSKGKPSADSTKIWITQNGRCIVANNNSKIPDSELADMLDIISAQFFVICAKWKEHFKVEDIVYYC